MAECQDRAWLCLPETDLLSLKLVFMFGDAAFKINYLGAEVVLYVISADFL